MHIAFRVTLDTRENPDILQALPDGFHIGDKFIVTAYAHHDDPRVHEIVGILTQYIPNIRYPATRPQDVYLIADGLVLVSSKATKVTDE